MKPRNLLIKIVTVILFSLLILSFAVWGIGDIFRSGGQTQAVAEVGDTVIEQRDFVTQLSREVSTLNQRLGTQLSSDQVRAFGIPQQVLSQMISRAVLDEKASRMGLLVTETQMHKQVFENPAFQSPGGSFDGQRFAQVLRRLNIGEQTYLQRVGEDTKRQHLVGAVIGGAEAPESLAEQVFAHRGERRIGDFVEVQQSSFDDLGEPEAAALQAAYDNASGRFMTPAYKSVSLVLLSLSEAAAQVAVPDERLVEVFEARKAELGQPERRAVSQALLPDQAAAQTLYETVSQGVDFTSAVEAATGRAPFDLGTVTKNNLPPELADTVFGLEEGQVSEPVQSALGWHVVLVSEVLPPNEAVFEDHVEELRKEVAEGIAVDTIIDTANRFDEELAAGSSMDQTAEFLNLKVREIPAIDAQGRTPEGEPVENLPDLQTFLATVNPLQPGEASTLKETRDGDFFMVRVDDVTPAQKRPLEDVRNEVVELWRSSEQERLAQEKAEAIAERVEAGETLAAVAEAEGLSLQETQPATRFETDQQRVTHPLIAQQLFEMAEGEVTTIGIPGSQVVVQLKEILPPEEEGRDARLAELEQQLTTGLQDDIFQQFLAALQQEYAVVVNQRLVDQVVSGF